MKNLILSLILIPMASHADTVITTKEVPVVVRSSLEFTGAEAQAILGLFKAGQEYYYAERGPGTHFTLNSSIGVDTRLTATQGVTFFNLTCDVFSETPYCTLTASYKVTLGSPNLFAERSAGGNSIRFNLRPELFPGLAPALSSHLALDIHNGIQTKKLNLGKVDLAVTCSDSGRTCELALTFK